VLDSVQTFPRRVSWRCADDTLVGLRGNHARVGPLRCRRWRCPTCGPHLQRREQARALAGFDGVTPLWFITVTSPAHDTVAGSFERVARRWGRLIELLRARYPAAAIEYHRIVEQQRRGHAHVHALVTGPILPPRVLRGLAVRAGFGYQATVRRALRADALYITKALGPQPSGVLTDFRAQAMGRYFHPASSSRGWAPGFRVLRDLWRRTVDPGAYRWRIVRVMWGAMAAALHAHGFTVDYAGP
jgi:hypothetical protein